MSALAMVALSLFGYLITAIGLMRPFYLNDYKSLREPRNGMQMPVLDAKRNAAKSAAGFAFAWPLVLAAGCVFLPLWVIFDLIPKGAKAIGRGVVAGATTAGPVALAPVVKWVTLPLEREIVAETALALEARADAGEGPEAPLVPDSIALWEPPLPGPVSASEIIEETMVRLRDELRWEGER
jgi:hypothetical protein